MSKKSENVNVIINGIEFTCKKSKYASNYSPVYVSDNMSGKMEGIPSISTSNLTNHICNCRKANKDSICAHCFADSTAKRYSTLAKNLEHNSNVLSNVLPLELLPKFRNVSIVRFESFGDLFCTAQVVNYFNICKVNPRVDFALWTKNAGIISKAIKEYGIEKPENLQIIISSPMLNTAFNFELVKRVFPFIDKMFTVYDSKTIAENGIEINCGSRDCAGCQNCYHANTNEIVNEKLK